MKFVRGLLRAQYVNLVGGAGCRGSRAAKSVHIGRLAARAPDRTPFPRSTPLALVHSCPHISFAFSNCPRKSRSGNLRSRHAPPGKSRQGQNSAARKYTQEALIRDAGNTGAYFNAYALVRSRPPVGLSGMPRLDYSGQKRDEGVPLGPGGSARQFTQNPILPKTMRH